MERMDGAQRPIDSLHIASHHRHLCSVGRFRFAILDALFPGAMKMWESSGFPIGWVAPSGSCGMAGIDYNVKESWPNVRYPALFVDCCIIEAEPRIFKSNDGLATSATDMDRDQDHIGILGTPRTLQVPWLPGSSRGGTGARLIRHPPAIARYLPISSGASEERESVLILRPP